MSTGRRGPLDAVQRTAAHAVVSDDAGALLLVRAAAGPNAAGRWLLPGGGVRHGEDPAAAVVREVAASTGVKIVVRGVRAAVADVVELPERGVQLHTLRLVYSAEPVGSPHNGDDVEFVPAAALAARPLVPFVADVLGLPSPPGEVGPQVAVSTSPEPLGPDVTVTPDVIRVQRPAAYAVLQDDDRVLLTHLSGHDDMWTLPGGGIDHGEDPVAALSREVYEETGLPYTPGRLVEVSSLHYTGRAPHGRLEDFHGIRLIYDGRVPGDVPPQVTEIDGSTDQVRWVPRAEVSALRVSGVVTIGLRAVLGWRP